MVGISLAAVAVVAVEITGPWAPVMTQRPGDVVRGCILAQLAEP